MINDVFSLKNFNVLEDNNNYYLFRALNKADNNDMADHFMATGEEPTRIRTDRERFEELHGGAKYSQDSEISLEEVYDHIKIHYLKETNCISLSTNSCVSLDYGANYYDKYAIITVPKENISTNVYPAGQYMLGEISKRTEEILRRKKVNNNILQILNLIENAKSYQEINYLIKTFVKETIYEKNISTRFNGRQYFTKEQQLEYCKIIGKATILEVTGILPSILPTKPDNQSLIASVGMAFSSGEVIYYKDIPKENFKFISKKMLNLVSLTQQLKEKFPQNSNVMILEKKLIELINEGYDIKSINDEIVLTNGVEHIQTGLKNFSTEIFNKTELDNNILTVEEIYNITGGRISYNKAKKAIEFCYSLSQTRKELHDYAFIVSAILGNNNLINEILERCFIIDPKIVARTNNDGYKVCESVNIGLENSKEYSFIEQQRLVRLIQEYNITQIEKILTNDGVAFRNNIIERFELGEAISKNEYFATSIINDIDFSKVFPENTREEYIEEIKEKLIKLLSNYEVSRLYNSFTNLDFNHSEISYYIFNLFIEKRLKGHTFEEICKLDNIDEFVADNFSMFNRDINELTLSNYLGIFTDSNYVKDSKLCLRDFQQRIKLDVDEIHSNNKRFAGVILPTGGGKSFIAMAEMMDRKDSKIVYVAPRVNILRNFKKNIVNYIGGIDPEGLTDKELNVIVKNCFPHLELICYQSLDENDVEKLASFKADYIILDEVHHIGGASWNRVIKKLLDNNPDSKVLGISATPQRDNYVEYQGEEYLKIYNGDMMMTLAAYLDNYTPEKLIQKQYLACDINLIDAIQEGYVICPNIVSFDYSLTSTEEYDKTLRLVNKIKDVGLKNKANEELAKMFTLIESAQLIGMDDVINEHLKVKDGKYILFIPRKPSDFEGSTDEYIEESIKKFIPNLKDIDTNPTISYIHSGRGDNVNLEVMRNFEIDNSKHIKILVAIDMLNEGVHLPNINGSFNFRNIDDKHLILSLQHLGRVISAVDPNKEYTEYDIPIVFDKYNIYSNLDFDRKVNKKSITSDLEKLKDAVFWIDKYGRIPNVNGSTTQEVKKAITLKRIQEKYAKFLHEEYDKYNLNEYDKKNTQKIVEICSKYQIWNENFGEITVEESRKLERVELFKVSATKANFLDVCSRVKEIAGVSTLTARERLQLLLQVVDIISENNIELSPNVIDINASMENFLANVPPAQRTRIKLELQILSVSDTYPFGEEYYNARKSLHTGKLLFQSYEYNKEDIDNLRRYGILCNGPDFKFNDERGFIVDGPKRLLRKNIYTGNYYGLDFADCDGINMFDFNIKTKIHRKTLTEYNEYGFNIDHIHKDTGTKWDKHGFDINFIHKDTGTTYDKRGFDINCTWYPKISANSRAQHSIRKYDDKGYNIDGYNKKGFNKDNIHKVTGKPYDEEFFDNDGTFWELAPNGERRKTVRKYNEKMYDRQGFLYEFDKRTNIVVKKGQVYNEYGFDSNGIHKKTKTTLDPKGYDINGIWHKIGPDGKYISTGSIFNNKGWTRDDKTIRHNAYGISFDKEGNLLLDIVDDYGFDINGRYHRPACEIDKDGFTEHQKGMIMYTNDIYYNKHLLGVSYDIHGFNCEGLSLDTGRILNKYNFDRNGYYWKKDEQGELYNTYSYFDDDGWTIDKKKYIVNKNGKKVYSSVDERGFDIDHLYVTGGHGQRQIADDNGFDYYRNHIATGTHLDEYQFDADSNYWKADENGNLINTYSKYNEDNWSQKHTNIETQRIVDKHGFNYMGLYNYPPTKRNKEGKISQYDPHGFNYQGIHRTTNKVYNKAYFDIDGYWYKKEGKEYIKTESKFDNEGYDINRLDKNGFTKNGYYKKTRRKTNEKGFFSNGINVFTKEPYDLNGIAIDGLPAKDVDWDLIERIKENNIFDKRMYIEDIIKEYITEYEWEELLSTYDYITDTFQEYFDELTYFIGLVQTIGIKPDEELYTEEEILDYIKRSSLKNERIKYNQSVSEFYYDMTTRNLIEEGILTSADIQDGLRYIPYDEEERRTYY